MNEGCNCSRWLVGFIPLGRRARIGVLHQDFSQIFSLAGLILRIRQIKARAIGQQKNLICNLLFLALTLNIKDDGKNVNLAFAC